MAIRDVILYPDARLKQVCLPVASSDVDHAQLAEDLIDTMESYPGCVGIAAPQIGELVRATAINVAGHRKAISDHGLLVLFDPVIQLEEGATIMREGCLSIPDFTANVRRAESVTVQADRYDRESGELSSIEITCDAYEARLVLHELDHLDGFLFLDRVDSFKDVFPRKRYR